MKQYDVCYDYLEYNNEHMKVFANNKSECRKSVKNGMGSYCKIKYIDEI